MYINDRIAFVCLLEETINLKDNQNSNCFICLSGCGILFVCFSEVLDTFQDLTAIGPDHRITEW